VAADGGGADGGDDRPGPPLLAGGDVGEVDFDTGSEIASIASWRA